MEPIRPSSIPSSQEWPPSISTNLGADAPKLLTALTGSPVADLAELSTRLPAALTNPEQTSDAPLVLTGTASFAALAEAQGNDVEQMARSAASGVALDLDLDIDELTQTYIDSYTSLMADVTIELGPNELVQEMTTLTDLAPMMAGLSDEDNAASLNMSTREASALAEAFADGTWIMESKITFEPDPGLAIEPAPATTEDRTAEYHNFLTAAGF